MHTKSKQCATTKFPLTETLVTDMHSKAGEGRQDNLEAGEGKHPLGWVGNLAEGSLAEYSLAEGSLAEGSLAEGNFAEGNLAEGSLAEGGEGKQTSHREGGEAA